MAKKQSGAKRLADKLLAKTKNGWSTLSKAERNRIFAFAADYREFLSLVKTEREAHDVGVSLAKQHGFVDLQSRIETGTPLQAGERVFYSAGGKTLILAHIGHEPLWDGLRIIGGHTDSPRLDLKPRPLYEEGGLALLDTHYYGGIKKYQWVTMPLALHGVVSKKNGETVSIAIGERAGEPVFVITDLLPHLGKDQADKKMGDAISGEGLNVLFASMPLDRKDTKDQVKRNALVILHRRYGIAEDDFVSAELELVPAGPARDLGIDESMILGYGHDDRVCAYTSVRALLDLKTTPRYTAVCILTDKEEIGSVGATGMYSFLFENAVAELMGLSGAPYSDLHVRRCLKRSKMLSADVNALHDPNYPEVSSPNSNMAQMNHGLVLTKYVGSRGKAGSNDASAEYMAELRRIFDDAGVIWQPGEIGKVDQGGGGTIAFMLARYEMDVVDCGVGVLSMHAPWEAVGKLDVYMAYKGYGAFYISE